MDKLKQENEELKNKIKELKEIFSSLHWHYCHRTANEQIFVDLVEKGWRL